MRTFLGAFFGIFLLISCNNPATPPEPTNGQTPAPSATNNPSTTNVSNPTTTATEPANTGGGMSESDRKELENRLQGSWEISLYGLGSSPALTKAQANEWLGIKISIGKTINCQYEHIPSAKGLQNTSKPFQILNISTIDPATLVQRHKISIANIFVTSPLLISIETNQTGTPFQHFYFSDKNEWFFCWKGVGFLMKPV